MITRDRIIGTVVLTLLAVAMLWGIFGHSKAFACDPIQSPPHHYIGIPDPHARDICLEKP